MLKTFHDGRLFGTTFGRGAPWILALHGWRRTHRDFVGSLGENGVGAEALDAIAVDLPGFGATPPPPEAWGAAQYAEALAPLLSDMCTPVAVLGHSFGGLVALRLAAERPESVRALVLTGVPRLVSVGPGRMRQRRLFRAGRVAHRLKLLSDESMERLRMRYGSADYRAAQGVMRQVLTRVLAEPNEHFLRAVKCPVELVWGDDDRDAPIEVARTALPAVPDGHLTVCPGAGHLVPLTAPGELRAALERHRQ